MTTISVTFLICLSEAKVNIKKSPEKNKFFDREIFRDTKSIEEAEFESSSRYIAPVEKPIKFLQIEYEIIPKMNYSIDVVYWGPVVKITTREGVKFFSSITKLKHTWITFTIEHKLIFDIPELMLLKSHTIDFEMRTEKNHMPSLATEPTAFFFLIDEIDLKCLFIEAFENIPNNDFDRVENDVKLILEELLRFAIKGESHNILKIPNINHRKKILNIINAFTANIDYKCFNTYSNVQFNANEILRLDVRAQSKLGPLKKKTNKSDRAKKSFINTHRRSSVQEQLTIELSVPGEALFTDPKMNTFHFLKKTSDVKCAYVIFNVDNLITPIQRNILNPVVIKLNKLINVPVNILLKERFEYLYLTYNLCDFTCTTAAKPIENKIYFKSHKIFFFEKQIKLFALLVQKDYLIVQLHGIRKRLVTSTAGIFGTHPLDKFISVPVKKTNVIEKYSTHERKANNDSAFIAAVCLKLNLLLSPFQSFSQTEICVHPNRCPVDSSKNSERPFAFTINSINTDHHKTPVYPLSEDKLLGSEFSLEVRMEVLRPLNKLLDNIIQKQICYNRIIIITGHVELIKYILSNVFSHNSCWIYKDDIVPPNYLPNVESNIDMNYVNIISGFSIDNGDIYITYLEGNAKWIKKVLWQHIKTENIPCSKILYNSDHVYKNRVYTDLIPYGGICNITLHTSIKTILESSKVFSPGYLPEPCRRAFEKIDMILKSNSTNEITINMLPTAKELLSLDIEWGVPVYWPITKQ